MDTFKIIMTFVLAAVLGYLIGSVNSSITVIKIWKKQDIRNYGSKNAGLTNTLRVYGKAPALVTLLCDLAKGVIAVILCRWIANLMGAVDNTIIVGYVAGIFVMIGHIFPLYYGFKGGKGVLIAATTLLAIDPVTFSIIIPFFAVILLITNYVSIASISAAAFYPVVTFFCQRMRNFETAAIDAIFAAIIGIIIIYMHRTNIKRLRNGTENKFRKNRR